MRSTLIEKVMINPMHIGGNYKYPHLETNRIQWTYLDGDLQIKVGYDIFGIVGEIPNFAGIYPADVLGVDENSTFFLWVGKDNRTHGLVVANSDTENYNNAMKKYLSKTSIL